MDVVQDNAAPSSQHDNANASHYSLGSWLRAKMLNNKANRSMNKSKKIKKGTRYDIPYMGGGLGSHHNP